MAKFNLIFAGYKGEASVHSEAARCFGEVLERELGDDVDFTLFSDTLTQGHKSGDLPGMVTEGEISFCYMATVRFAKFVPECVLFDLPFITNDRAELFGALDGALGDFFKDAMAKATPHKVLGFWDNGLRHITNRERPLYSPADCRGLTIRTQISETIGDLFRAVGFTPRPLDIKIYRDQIESPAIQAQDNDLPTIYNF
jgi:TRAP-type C4-dicarboxylate transport system substrate-binding protein